MRNRASIFFRHRESQHKEELAASKTFPSHCRCCQYIACTPPRGVCICIPPGRTATHARCPYQQLHVPIQRPYSSKSESFNDLFPLYSQGGQAGGNDSTCSISSGLKSQSIITWRKQPSTYCPDKATSVAFQVDSASWLQSAPTFR